MKILNSLILSFCLLFAFGFAFAEETAVTQDENISAQDLGISEPTLLPDSPFYFFKNLGRAIQSAITLDPVKKTELREKFANEKLIELKKITEKTQNSEVIKKATENYQKEVANVEKLTERIRETAEENVQVGQFLDKFIQQQALHQAILQKLETQVPENALEKIQEAREAHLENFGQVMTRLENKERVQERLETNLRQIEGSEFKNFKNLEMLQALEEKAPEAIKEAVQQVRVNVMTQLKEQVKEMTAEKLQQFQTYTENISGVKEKQMEILESLKTELKNSPQIIQNLNQSRERIMEQVKTKTQETEGTGVNQQVQTQTQTQTQDQTQIRTQLDELQRQLKQLQGQ